LKGVAAEKDLLRDFCRPLRGQALNRKCNDDVAGRMELLLSGTRAMDFCRLVGVRQGARRRKLRAVSIDINRRRRTRTFVVGFDNRNNVVASKIDLSLEL
jgi:hypothetical protein